MTKNEQNKLYKSLRPKNTVWIVSNFSLQKRKVHKKTGTGQSLNDYKNINGWFVFENDKETQTSVRMSCCFKKEKDAASFLKKIILKKIRQYKSEISKFEEELNKLNVILSK